MVVLPAITALGRHRQHEQELAAGLSQRQLEASLGYLLLRIKRDKSEAMKMSLFTDQQNWPFLLVVYYKQKHGLVVIYVRKRGEVSLLHCGCCYHSNC